MVGCSGQWGLLYVTLHCVRPPTTDQLYGFQGVAESGKELGIETRHTCSPNRGSGSPCGPGLVSGVSVREMAEEKIFMMSFLEANWPLSVGINGNCSVW